MAEQLPLQFEYRGDQTFADYYPGNNQETIDHLQRCVSRTGEQFIFIWGSIGQGKSHLLQACCRQASDFGQKCLYLPLDITPMPAPKILEGLEAMDLVCIDDLHKIAGLSEWEQALFACFNRLRDNGTHLIISADCKPTQLPVQLVDLQTRLNWGLTLKLQPLDEQGLISALALRAGRMGFEIPPKVGRFLLTHYTRDLQALWNLLARLDHATLAAKRKVTIPFLKQVLGL